MHKIGQSEGILGELLGQLLKTGSFLIKNLLKPLAKNFLIPSELTAAASVTDAAIHKKMFESGTPPSNLAKQTTLIILNKEMNYILTILKSLEKCGLLIKDVSKTIQNKAIQQKGGFLSMLLGTLGASLLRNMLTGTDTIRSGEGMGSAGQPF